MSQKKIAQNQGESGRINVSGSELQKFDAQIGEEIEVDVAESPSIAKAMIDSKDSNTFIIVSKSANGSKEET